MCNISCEFSVFVLRFFLVGYSDMDFVWFYLLNILKFEWYDFDI